MSYHRELGHPDAEKRAARVAAIRGKIAGDAEERGRDAACSEKREPPRGKSAASNAQNQASMAFRAVLRPCNSEIRRTLENAMRRISLTACWTLLAWASSAPLARAAAVDAGEVFDRSGIRRGLFVVVADEPGLGLALAAEEPVLVHVLSPAEKVAEMRSRIVAANLHGRVTASRRNNAWLPLIDNLAAVVVADLDRDANLDRNELLRVLRPGGRLLVKQKQGSGRSRTSRVPRTSTIGRNTITTRR